MKKLLFDLLTPLGWFIVYDAQNYLTLIRNGRKISYFDGDDLYLSDVDESILFCFRGCDNIAITALLLKEYGCLDRVSVIDFNPN